MKRRYGEPVAPTTGQAERPAVRLPPPEGENRAEARNPL